MTTKGNIICEINAIAIVKPININDNIEWIIGSYKDIEIGKPLMLLLENGSIIQTPSIIEWHNYTQKALTIYDYHGTRIKIMRDLVGKQPDFSDISLD